MTPPRAAPERKPHADLDVDSRRLKAVKIERLLRLEPSARPIRLLEIGTGSGVIAHHFATHPELNCEVSAVDLIDQRVMSDGYEFRLVEGTRLPFKDSSFDVVLSNHVIEHVGGRDDQQAHLDEIRRVMGAGAVGYLATPNRWALVEPHFRLAFLSWLPRAWRDGYVQLMGRGDLYDCDPLSSRDLHNLLDEVGFEYEHIEAKALSVANEVETASSQLSSLVRRLLVPVLDLRRPLAPTFVCLLSVTGVVDAR